MRLQRFLRDQKIASLRKCDEWVASRRVFVNGIVVDTPTYYLQEGDEVSCLGESFVFHSAEVVKHFYFLFNKPPRVLCSHRDPDGRKLIFDYFKSLKTLEGRNLFYGGRLDYLSRGLVILSTDGGFIHRVTHPSQKWEKVYLVTARAPIDREKLDRLAKGNGPYRPFKFYLINKRYVRIILEEGRNRQIRNIFEMIDNDVLDLFRTRVGDYSVDDLMEGEYREIHGPPR